VLPCEYYLPPPHFALFTHPLHVHFSFTCALILSPLLYTQALSHLFSFKQTVVVCFLINNLEFEMFRDERGSSCVQEGGKSVVW